MFLSIDLERENIDEEFSPTILEKKELKVKGKSIICIRTRQFEDYSSNRLSFPYRICTEEDAVFFVFRSMPIVID